MTGGGEGENEGDKFKFCFNEFFVISLISKKNFRDDPDLISTKNSVKLIEQSSIKKVGVVQVFFSSSGFLQ